MIVDNYIKAKEFIKSLKFKKREDYFIAFRNKELFNLPGRPDLKWRDEWESWAIFLGNNNICTRYIKYLPIESIIDLIKEHNIKSSREWYKFYLLNKNKYNIPSSLNKQYNKNSFFFFKTISDSKINKYLFSYEKAKYICNYYNIKSHDDYNKIRKFYNKLPAKISNYKYPLWDKPKILSYIDSKKFLSIFKFKSIYEWNYFLSKKPKFIPRHPDEYYKNEWEGWDIFLNYKLSKISTGENIIKKYLDSNNIEYIFQKKFDDCTFKKKLKFDFFLETKNIVIEFDGKQHYEPIKLFGGKEFLMISRKRDRVKNDYCLNNKIKLIRIKYSDILNIESILKNKLT